MDTEDKKEEQQQQPNEEAAQSQAQSADEVAAEKTVEEKLAEAEAALEKEKKEYLFLMADMDNMRKRFMKEKAEILRNGAEAAMKALLPVVDDFERGIDAIKNTSDAEAVKEGMILIYNKFMKYLEQNGVKPMESDGQPFNEEFHEAVALVPGLEDKKGLVIDTVQKGYMINDKVLRHAKVAVAQ
ncbi:MAG: nucleotide exchange factor GrpE [Bacteroidales bacterium]|nr:nucleotide exchange factor GrpE [Bacteroidales bacterium]